MIENKLSIEIDVPVDLVFRFTINPDNTPKWIESIAQEEIIGNSIGLDTKYRNVDLDGKIRKYFVTEFEPDTVFALRQVGGIYHVRYTYEQISEKKTRLTYFEWVDDGELEAPFRFSALEKLKGILEKK